ncbi:hypothetical protein CPB84DRAFT_1851692 [Gymnopilus junonius]|uniref:F-box domain-containing protein n=1 Tax=Gymnopilus junonius TaxID=109634 RepID=A0A9P5THD2_GYMJU|nr:hypothetical protein CPB84DRAFT_1851692 [Gymnopilus junonius]
MHSCSRCGHIDRPHHLQPRELCRVSKSHWCDVCAKLDYLNVKITRAQAALQELFDQRDDLRTQLNQAHPSIVDRLPVEIASTIFTLYASNISRTESPLILGAVCQNWRQIAWTTPSVWMFLRFRSYTSRAICSETRLQLVRDWLIRSKKTSLSIDLGTYSLKGGDGNIQQVYHLVDIINQHCDHWHSLDLHMPSFLLAHFNDTICDSSALHTLSMASTDSSANDPDLTIPSLSRVSPKSVKIYGPLLNPHSLNWDRVTHLTLLPSAIDQILQILRMGPALQSCCFALSSSRSTIPVSETDSAVTHPLLHSLDIEAANDSLGLFFSNVTFPALGELSIRGIDLHLQGQEFASFLTRSSSGLKSLNVDEVTFTSEDFLRMIRLTPYLEELDILLGSTDADVLTPFYQALANHLPANDGLLPQLTRPLLPSLRAFGWMGDDAFPWEAIPRFFAPFSADDRTRRRPLEEITICCSLQAQDPIPYISEDVISQLSEFANQVRFKFDVDIDGKVDDLWKLSLEKIEKKDEGSNVAQSNLLYGYGYRQSDVIL